MYTVKKLNKDCQTKLLYQSTWLVENTVRYSELTITPKAVLIAKEGKFLTLTVNGVGREIAPGTYYGDVVISVGDAYAMAPHALMRQNKISCDFEAAITVDEKAAKVNVPEIVQGGSVSGEKAENLYIGTTAESYNGILVTGDAEYEVNGCEFDFEGFGNNDFMGVGAGVAAVDNAKVTINDSQFYFSGVTRCPVHAGGQSTVTANRCDMVNMSPDSDWLGVFSWQVAMIGTNRLCQLADGAKATYNECNLTTNGWGICSIDGTNAPVELTINKSKMRLIGPRSHGYGAFCIGNNKVTIKDCDVQVNGYPLLVMGMQGGGRPSILGSKISGRRFGAMVYGDANSIFEIKDSSFNTGKSTLVVKGSSTVINIDNTKMSAGNNVALQMMDTDECGMNSLNFVVPVGEIDEYVPGRDLSAASEADDVILNIKNSEISGNFFNSTTNLRASKRSTDGGKGLFHDTLAGLSGMDDSEEAGGMPGGPGGMPGGAPGGMPGGAPGGMPGGMPMFKDNSGPKNLGLNLENVKIHGAISSATAKYRDGLTEITAANRMELSNITQKAAPTVNNGIVITMDGKSAWEVAETSYITGLTLAPGAVVSAIAGKTLTVTVDGKAVTLAPGSYKGKIVLEVK